MWKDDTIRGSKWSGFTTAKMEIHCGSCANSSRLGLKEREGGGRDGEREREREREREKEEEKWWQTQVSLKVQMSCLVTTRSRELMPNSLLFSVFSTDFWSLFSGCCCCCFGNRPPISRCQIDSAMCVWADLPLLCTWQQQWPFKGTHSLHQ